MLITSSEEGKKFIEGQDWKTIIFKLTKYALYRLKLYKWYGKEGGNVGAGKAAEDYAMQAIEKFLDGTRHWNPEKCDLLGFLRGCIKSDMGAPGEWVGKQELYWFRWRGWSIRKWKIPQRSLKDWGNCPRRELGKQRNMCGRPANHGRIYWSDHQG